MVENDDEESSGPNTLLSSAVSSFNFTKSSRTDTENENADLRKKNRISQPTTKSLIKDAMHELRENL